MLLTGRTGPGEGGHGHGASEDIMIAAPPAPAQPAPASASTAPDLHPARARQPTVAFATRHPPVQLAQRLTLSLRGGCCGPGLARRVTVLSPSEPPGRDRDGPPATKP